MKNHPILPLIIGLTLLCGCTYNVPQSVQEKSKRQAINKYHNATKKVRVTGSVDKKTTHAKQFQAMENPLLNAKKQRDYSQKSVQNINHYVRALTQDMMSNIKPHTSQKPMAVSSFVFLDTDYQKGSLLGNQIAESFIHELHEFGVPVVDFKTTNYLRVTPTGDFTFSRDFLELKHNHPMQYVLAGTLTKHQGGVLVNARIIGIKSKLVIATAQGLIPSSVVNALQQSTNSNQMELSAIF